MNINLIIRGRSDKYLAYKRKTKILEKWRFISQHSLLLAQYTWPSDAPTSLTRLKSTFSRGLQSRPPWQRWPPRSTEISARRVTFSSLETKRSRTPNLENTVDGAAARSPIRPICRITDRYCSFSIFLKSADTPASTRGQNKTTSPIRLKFWQ